MTRTTLVVWGLVALGGLGVWLGVSQGPAELDGKRVFIALFGGGDSASDVIILSLRLPRIATSLVVGACLGAAGTMLQSSTRNPLGDPQIFGIGGGAAIVQAFALTGALQLGPWGLTTFSVVASLIGAGVIAFFASHKEISPARLALVGVSIGALLLAIATGIMAASQVFTQQSLALIGGSMANRGWEDWLPTLPYLVIGLAIAGIVAGRLNLLALGDSIAGNLGGNPVMTRAAAMASAGILSGAAVAVAGLVGFVGLLAPHLARWLMGHDTRTVLAVATPLGAVLTLLADQAARLMIAPSEIPVGMVTTVLGAPLMIYVARRVT